MVAQNHTHDGHIDHENAQFVDANVRPSERDMVQWVESNPNIGAPERVSDTGDGFIVYTDADEAVENTMIHAGLTIVAN